MFPRHRIAVAFLIAASACDTLPSTGPRGPEAAAGAVADKQATTGSQILLSILFSDPNTGIQTELYRMNDDGTNLVRLTYDLTTSEGEASWAPDGKRILFTRSYPDRSAIFVMNADGTGVTQLTFTPSVTLDRDPVAFGKQIVFTRFDGPTTTQSLYVMNADGTQVTQFPQTVGGVHPAPSPKGGRIAFQLDGDIYLLDVASGGLTNLTNSAQLEEYPAYSPSGKQIAFARSGSDGGIFVMNEDGTEVTRVTTGDTDTNPQWSPDGKRLAFSRTGGATEDIYSINADGTGLTDLTRTPDTQEFLSAWARQ